jgi:hypothetical protein
VRTTNHFNLPEAFVRFDAKHQHSKGSADYSATELIDSPRVSRLRKRHYEEIEEDIADKVMALLGTAVHTILEQGAPSECIVEERISTTIDGVEVSGGIDLQTPDGDGYIISDYKTCGAFAIQANPDGKQEWENQLNVYASLAESNGKLVNGLEVVAIIRDWSAAAAERSEDYPKHSVIRIPIKLWTPEERDRYLRERISLHTQKEVPECTPSERWERPTRYAVHSTAKDGSLKKRATRVFDTLVDAQSFMMDKAVLGEIQVRLGESIRCKSYCSVAPHCSQWKKLQETNDGRK